MRLKKILMYEKDWGPGPTEQKDKEKGSSRHRPTDEPVKHQSHPWSCHQMAGPAQSTSEEGQPREAARSGRRCCFLLCSGTGPWKAQNTGYELWMPSAVNGKWSDQSNDQEKQLYQNWIGEGVVSRWPLKSFPTQGFCNSNPCYVLLSFDYKQLLQLNLISSLCPRTIKWEMRTFCKLNNGIAYIPFHVR